MGRAVSVIGPAAQRGSLCGFSRCPTGNWRGIEQSHSIVRRGRQRDQMLDYRGNKRSSRANALVVTGLLGNVWEEVPHTFVNEAMPFPFGVTAQEYLSDGEADQLR